MYIAVSSFNMYIIIIYSLCEVMSEESTGSSVTCSYPVYMNNIITFHPASLIHTQL